jgi:hypothetical protein
MPGRMGIGWSVEVTAGFKVPNIDEQCSNFQKRSLARSLVSSNKSQFLISLDWKWFDYLEQRCSQYRLDAADIRLNWFCRRSQFAGIHQYILDDDNFTNRRCSG